MLHPVDDARNGLNIQFLAAHNLISHVQVEVLECRTTCTTCTVQKGIGV